MATLDEQEKDIMDKFDQLLKQSEDAIKESNNKKKSSGPSYSYSSSSTSSYGRPLKNDYQLDLPSLEVPEFEACLGPDSKFDTSLPEINFDDVVNPPPQRYKRAPDLSGFQDALEDLNASLPSLMSEQQSWGKWKIIGDIGQKLTEFLVNKSKFNAGQFLLTVKQLKTQAEEFQVSDDALDAIEAFTRASVTFVKGVGSKKFIADGEFAVGTQPVIAALTNAINAVNANLQL